MSSPIIRYDYEYMTADSVGKEGETQQALAALDRKLAEAREALRRKRGLGQTGFFSAPYDTAVLKRIKKQAAAAAGRCRDVVVIGIGGSDLGARAVIKALQKPGKGMNVHFIGANTDPDELAALIAKLDFRKTVLNVISKSGDTIEPMSAFLVLRQALIKKVGRKKHAAQVIATTDEKKGTLRAIADREGYATLPVPEAIGGRFSALTGVALFPAACAGIAVADLLAGARQTDELFWEEPANKNAAAMFAGLLYDAYRRRSLHISVLMPYAESLRDLALWYRQLLAESLGKKYDADGNVVYHGITPEAALGATDQHSQLQLWSEGPFDKTITFIEIEKFGANLKVPAAFPDLEGVAYMKGLALGDIIHAERQATAMALAQAGRPNGTITLPALNAKSLGATLQFFMSATALLGELLKVNAYDQPGVEASKRTMYALLGRRGYSL